MTDRDPAPRRTAAICTIGLVAVSLLWSCFVADAVHDFPGPQRWWIPGDVWIPLLPAHFIAQGAFAFLYEAHPGYWYPPGMAILWAPIAAVGDHFLLSESTTIVVQRPTMWLLICPVGCAVALVPLLTIRRAAWTFGGRRGLDVLQVAVVVVAFVPIAVVWGHYEELMVIGGLIEAARLVLTGRPRRAGWALALALLFKQTAVLALPMLVLQVVPDQRRAMLVRAFAPLALLCTICLVADWTHASQALLGTQSFPQAVVGRTAVWVGDSSLSVLASPFRVSAVLVAGAVAVALRNRHDPASVMSGLAIVFSLRLVLEPVVLPYYLGAPFTFLALVGVVEGRGLVRTTVLGAAATLWFVSEVQGMLWWFVFGAMLLALAVGPARILRSTGPVPDVTPST